MGAPHKILAAVLLPALCAAGDWTVARDAHFEVYSQEGERTARAALRWFSQLRSTVLRETGLDAGGKNVVRVIGFRSEAEYARYRPGPAADAYYVGAGDRNYIVMPSLEEASFPVAAHEYAHLLQHAAASRLPPWLSEGLADVFSTVRIDSRGSRIGGEARGRLDVLRRGSWMPLNQLMTLPAHAPQREIRSTSEIFYAESWALTEMLALSPGYRPGFAAFLAALASGAESVSAAEATWHKSLDAMRQDLAAWVSRRSSKSVPLADPEPDAVAATVADVPAGVVPLILAELLLTAGNVAEAESAYRELAAAFPENAQVWAGLGAVAATRKQFDGARVFWKRALGLGLADAGVCFRYAELLDGPDHREERREALQRAVSLRPDFDDARWVLALLEENANQYEASLEQLRAMHEVAPARAYHYWCAVADALTGLGLAEEAQTAARRAAEHASTPEDRARAVQLAYMARTRLAVRLTHDAAGNPQMVTTRVPRDTVEFNPFIEPDDDVQRVQGTLREIECGDSAMRLTVETAKGILVLAILDRSRVQMRHAPEELTCGPQTGTPVVVEYAAGKEKDGVVRGLEFR